MNLKLNSRCRAFTLIEIMVAMAIFAMVVAAVYTTWVLLLRSSQVAQQAAAQVQRQRIAIRTIEDSLTCIQSFQASIKYYAFDVTNGDQPSLSFVSRVPDVFPRNGRFGDFNLRRLTFTIEQGPDADKDERDLVLRQNPILMDMDPDEQNYPLVLARNVKDFIIECWDTNALDWVDTWDSTNTIPPLVRVTLSLGGNATDTSSAAPILAVTREIAVPAITLPSVVQTGVPGGGGGGGGAGGINTGGGGNGSVGKKNNPNQSTGPNNPNRPNNPNGQRVPRGPGNF
jgi:prepilin-type N-terminal cleavage/methylation domain-containing protein